MRNVEIKAYVRDPKQFIQKTEAVAVKTRVFQQVDYFFNVPKERGRLKMRIESDVSATKADAPIPIDALPDDSLSTEDDGDAISAGPAVFESGRLIYYQRDDQVGPKLSKYIIYETKEPMILISTLEMALGISGKVQKQRTLYMFGQTRIHYDQVNGLGRFMELEVVLDDTQTLEEGRDIANSVMEMLGIDQTDLVKGAYHDILQLVHKAQMADTEKPEKTSETTM